MLWRSTAHPRLAGFIEPCLPSPAPNPPAGTGWIHEIKHDGFRLMARRDAAGVRLLMRRGNDWTARYPSIAAALAGLSCHSCLIDGEVVVCGDDGVPVFDRLRYGRRPQSEAVLIAFDLLELGGKELRRTPLEDRKLALFKLLRKAAWALHFNDHIDEPGDIVFRHACKLGLDGTGMRWNLDDGSDRSVGLGRASGQPSAIKGAAETDRPREAAVHRGASAGSHPPA